MNETGNENLAPRPVRQARQRQAGLRLSSLPTVPTTADNDGTDEAAIAPDLTWQDPPPPAEPAPGRLERITTALHQHPGRWALIHTATSPLAIPWWASLRESSDYQLRRVPTGAGVFGGYQLYARYAPRDPDGHPIGWDDDQPDQPDQSDQSDSQPDNQQETP